MPFKTNLFCACLIVLFYEVFSECQQSLTTVSGTHAPTGKICSGQIIFEDNFEQFRLDIWKHENTLGGGSSNNQFQWYTNNRSNSFAKDSILHIRPTLLTDERGEDYLYDGTLDINGAKPIDDCTNPSYDGCIRKGTPEIILNPVKSARIHTTTSFAFKYGKVEVRAKMPIGDWLWPAVWMKPRWNQYSTWPASGEIDIVESRGNRMFIKNNVNIGVEQVCCTLHWGPNSNYNRYIYTFFYKNNGSRWHDDFHNYQLYWTPENISFSIDNELLGVVVPPNGGFWELGQLNETGLDNPWIYGSKMAPFDQEFYFLVNMAVGGTSFFSDVAQNIPYEKPWKNNRGRASMTDFWKAKDSWLSTWNSATDDSHLLLDYIKVWAL